MGPRRGETPDAASRVDDWVRDEAPSAPDAVRAFLANANRAAPDAHRIAPRAPSGIATPDNAASFASRGVPLAQALQRSLIVTVPELEKFIDDYVAFTASRPALKGLHDDAVRVSPEIFAARLATEEAELRRREAAQRMDDRLRPLTLRAPLAIQDVAAAGEVIVPIGQAVGAIVQFVPVAGELLAAVEVITGKTAGGLGFDIPAEERALSAALLVAPYAASALRGGVRGAVTLARLAQATGSSTEASRKLCRALVTLQTRAAALKEAFAAARQGRALTVAQKEALAAAREALETIHGAAARSRLDPKGRSFLTNAEKAMLPEFRPNADGVVRSASEALAVAKRHGVEVPSWVKIEFDPKTPLDEAYAHYWLPGTGKSTNGRTWGEATKGGTVLVRVHPEVLRSDEMIVGVLQHEAYELEALRRAFEQRGTMRNAEIERLVDPRKHHNLHGQAWDVADMRVQIMREHDPTKKVALEERLDRLQRRFSAMNQGL